MIPYFPQPELELGPLTLHSFGVLVAMAILVGSEILHRRAKHEGLNTATAARMVTWVLIGGFLGAHLVDSLVYFPEKTLRDPWRLLRIWEGISSFGGFIGAIVGAALFIRVDKLGKDTWRYLDAICYAFVFGWIFGRLGCFTAFDHPGSPTDFFLGMADRNGVVRHNLGLEEALYTMGMAGLFFVMGKRPRHPGFFSGWLPILYAPFRFMLDFMRVVDVRYFGLTPGQWGSIALLLLGIFIVRYTRATQPMPTAAPSAASDQAGDRSTPAR